MTEHQPVLLDEAINGLSIKDNGIYVDGTFGRGGHSRVILERLGESGQLIVIDKDPEAIAYANHCFVNDQRVSIASSSFAKIGEIAVQLKVAGRINGILLDLGVSSPQIDNAERGFSFMQSGPLDMRMDTTQELSASSFVNQAQASEMALIFREYGEERFSGRIAQAIVNAREISPILTTEKLAQIVTDANPKWEKHKHPATRVFQAIRIHVNQELNDLKKGLIQCIKALAVGGRIAVISFHSLEDRIVKQFMRNAELGVQLPIEVPVKASDIKRSFKRVGKAIKSSELEIRQNVRARSAVLRIGEKTA